MNPSRGDRFSSLRYLRQAHLPLRNRVHQLPCSSLALAASATPAIQPPLTPPPGFTGPAVEAGGLRMDDGARLPLARWTPETGEPWAVIVALHGMNDSRAAFRMAGPWWAERGIETWAIDQRGFGEAPGRGVWAGEARMTEDLRTAVALARTH